MSTPILSSEPLLFTFDLAAAPAAITLRVLFHRGGESTKDSPASFTCHLEAALRASGRAEGAPQDAERLAHPNGRLLLPKVGEVDQQVSLPVAMVRVSVCKEGGVAVEESLVIDDPEVLAHERVRLIQLDIGRLLRTTCET